jgi:hypothetical protein
MVIYSWQRMTTDIVHGRYRVVVDYEICNDYEYGIRYYTGGSVMSYISAYP